VTIRLTIQPMRSPFGRLVVEQQDRGSSSGGLYNRSRDIRDGTGGRPEGKVSRRPHRSFRKRYRDKIEAEKKNAAV